jgi:hypothetical protein
MPALTGALLLAESEAHACEGCPTTYGSIGPLVSLAFGTRTSFGVGGEFSVNHLPDNSKLIGYGGYVNFVQYSTRSYYNRFNVGAQGNLLAFGAEVGVSYLSSSLGPRPQPSAIGVAVGAFAAVPYFVLLAFRTTFPFDGEPQAAIDLGLKFPFVLQGDGYSSSGHIF